MSSVTPDPVQLIPAVAPDAHIEARRVMSICNACRYCEGYCAVFQAMSRRRDFPAVELDWYANLCHQCTACYHACQYAPPHEFGVNVPRALADLRADTWVRYAWPGPLARAFEKNGLVLSLVTALVLALTLTATFTLLDRDVLFAEHIGEGAFYRVIGHGVMVILAGLPFLFSGVALAISGWRYWQDISSGDTALPLVPAATALGDVATLKYLGGGHGDGCNTEDDRFSNLRRWYHQFTMWGFLLCFAATSLATAYHYVLGIEAPYPLTSLPVLFGIVGGLGLLVGPVGLLWCKLKADPVPMPVHRYGMDVAFLALLFLVSLTGFAVMLLRETSAMGVLLAAHLAVVLAFFLTLPYSRFVHGIYRLVALLRFAVDTWKIDREYR